MVLQLSYGFPHFFAGSRLEAGKAVAAAETEYFFPASCIGVAYYKLMTGTVEKFLPYILRDKAFKTAELIAADLCDFIIKLLEIGNKFDLIF